VAAGLRNTWQWARKRLILKALAWTALPLLHFATDLGVGENTLDKSTRLWYTCIESVPNSLVQSSPSAPGRGFSKECPESAPMRRKRGE
jgi:hypothetical protein